MDRTPKRLPGYPQLHGSQLLYRGSPVTPRCGWCGELVKREYIYAFLADDDRVEWRHRKTNSLYCNPDEWAPREVDLEFAQARLV